VVAMRNLLMAAFLIGCGALGRDLTPLVLAVRAGDAAKVRSLVGSGANIEERAGGSGQRYALPGSDVPAVEPAHEVDAQAFPSTGIPPDDGDVDDVGLGDG